MLLNAASTSLPIIHLTFEINLEKRLKAFDTAFFLDFILKWKVEEHMRKNVTPTTLYVCRLFTVSKEKLRIVKIQFSLRGKGVLSEEKGGSICGRCATGIKVVFKQIIVILYKE